MRLRSRRLAVLATVGGGVLGLATGTASAADPVGDAQRALGAGDGTTAARIIASSGLASQPTALADIIYGGGVIAVGQHRGNGFAQAVPIAFVDGGVTLAQANTAFGYAAAAVAKNAATDKQLLMELGPGGIAIFRTELLYAGVTLPPLADPDATAPPAAPAATPASGTAAPKPATKPKPKPRTKKTKRPAKKKAAPKHGRHRHH